MNTKQYSILAVLAVFLILVSAIFDRVVSIILALSILFAFGLYRIKIKSFTNTKRQFPVILIGLLTAPIIAFCIVSLVKSVRPNAFILPNTEADGTIAEQLRECLPKSDMKSKAVCDRLISRITSFDECIVAGFSARGSSPETCQTSDGRLFTRKLIEDRTAEKRVTVSGKFTCLPRKDTKGPATLECAMGLETKEGFFYSLDLSETNTDPAVYMARADFVTVEGSFVPVEAISSDIGRMYDILGVIRVTNISQ